MAKKVTIAEMVISLSTDNKKAIAGLKKTQRASSDAVKSNHRDTTKTEKSKKRVLDKGRKSDIARDKNYVALKKRDRVAAAKFEKQYLRTRNNDQRRALKRELSMTTRTLSKIDKARDRSSKAHQARVKRLQVQAATGSTALRGVYRDKLKEESNRGKATNKRFDAKASNNLSGMLSAVKTITLLGSVSIVGAGAALKAGFEQGSKGIDASELKRQQINKLKNTYLNNGMADAKALTQATSDRKFLQSTAGKTGLQASDLVLQQQSLQEVFPAKSIDEIRKMVTQQAEIAAQVPANLQAGFLQIMREMSDGGGVTKMDTNRLGDATSSTNLAKAMGFESAKAMTAAIRESDAIKVTSQVDFTQFVDKLHTLEAGNFTKDNEGTAKIARNDLALAQTAAYESLGEGYSVGFVNALTVISNKIKEVTESGTFNKLGDQLGVLAEKMASAFGEWIDRGGIERMNAALASIKKEDINAFLKTIESVADAVSWLMKTINTLMGVDTETKIPFRPKEEPSLLEKSYKLFGFETERPKGKDGKEAPNFWGELFGSFNTPDTDKSLAAEVASYGQPQGKGGAHQSGFDASNVPLNLRAPTTSKSINVGGITNTFQVEKGMSDSDVQKISDKINESIDSHKWDDHTLGGQEVYQP